MMSSVDHRTLNFVFFVFLMVISSANSLQRTLNYAFNEDCKELCKNTNVRLAHVTAIGPNDTLHYLWDFTKNPSILIAVTSPAAKLVIDWHKYIMRIPNSLNFTEKPIYIFGVSIERLLEFNDINDKARIDEATDKNIKELKFENFEWHYKNITSKDNFVELYMKASKYHNPETNERRHGIIKFLMHGFGTLNHSRITPCMLHSENATQIDITLENIETERSFSKSRFAFELLIVSDNDPNTLLEVNTKRKLDDEFTPGIFEILELSTPVIYKKSAYLQWRPVSYIKPDRDVTNSSSTVFYPIKNATTDIYFSNTNLLYMYYGENMFNILVQRMNISLGGKGDNVYKETQYATWTFIVGYGFPPEERFSNIVIMIISIGVGLPLLILIMSGIYVCVRRRPKQPSDEFTHHR
ncbi:PREDICTED: lysosomal protein NCU-G1-like [Ceratosolen solmsi marchali]|uniref:Lysosomal protein NCU-G1-like n=1 Tax=Ceratosolen solmsi marchali TaxID=326594 RepID=A0AAJ6YU95_9HYME|nr:PREDICTED: lysosomal protein NCU-G1-like [Ceratosolen solmsi marchali]